MKKLRHEFAMLDCLLESAVCRNLANRRVEEKLLDLVVVRNIRESHDSESLLFF